MRAPCATPRSFLAACGATLALHGCVARSGRGDGFCARGEGSQLVAAACVARDNSGVGFRAEGSGRLVLTGCDAVSNLGRECSARSSAGGNAAVAPALL
jgi:hypothetical protein